MLSWRFFISVLLHHVIIAITRVGTKTLFLPFAKTKTFTKGATVFAKCRQFFTKSFRENLNLTKGGIKYQKRNTIWSRIRGFLASWIQIRRIQSGSWSYLRTRISAKIPWIRNTDMEIFFRLMNVKRCFRR
jgi:hypothetical protein